jgi:peptidoglycan/xylan/chitin deacetylase (PgdA/CDA1 family)
MTAGGLVGPDLAKLSLGQVPKVLMYHGVEAVNEDPHELCVTPARFSEQMTWLAEHGWRGVSMGELVAAMRAGRERGLVGLTFDDGYVNVLTTAVPELQRHGFTATMFIISGLLGRTNEWEDEGTPVWRLMSAGQVAEVAAAGMEIGSHTVTHPRLRGIPEERLRVEVGESRSALGELTGQTVRGFAYPYGSMDGSARQAVRDAGYEYACAVETPLSALGIVAVPRIIFGQRDGSGRMAAKTMFFRSYTAARGTKRGLSYSPLAQRAKRGLSAIAHPASRPGGPGKPGSPGTAHPGG